MRVWGLQFYSFSHERSGDQTVSNIMRHFNKFIRRNGLIDFPFIGSHCTWSRQGSWSRIDRFLVP